MAQHIQIKDAAGVLAKITDAIDTNDDDLGVLSEIDKILSAAGLGHVDPLYTMDEPDAKVFLIWRVLLMRDWFPSFAHVIDRIIDTPEHGLDIELTEGLES